MTKEVDLFLGETKSVETTKTKSAEKKEGGSLFDSMLTTAKKDTTETKNNKTTTSTQEKTTPTEVKEKPVTQNKNEQISENKTTKVTDESQSIKDNKNATSSKETDESTKNENLTKKQSGSLLDKLIVEAKGTLEKGTDTKETKQDVKNNETISSDESKKEIDKELKDAKNGTKKTEADLEVETNKSQKNSNEEKVEVKDNKKETKNLDEKLNNLKENNSTQIVDDNKDNSDRNLTVDKKEETSKAELKSDKVVIDNDAKTEVQKNSAENRVVTDNTADNSNEKILKEVKNADNKVEKTAPEKVVTNLKEEVKNENPSKASIEKNVQPNESKVETDITKVKPQENVKSDDNAIKNNKIETAVKEPVVEKTTLNQSETNSVKNEKVAQELAKLNSNEKAEEKVNIKQDNLASSNDKKSLLDKLVDESKKEMATSQKTDNSDLKVLQEQTKDTKSGLLTSMYLSSQKKSLDDKSLEVKHEGKETALNAKNVDDVKQSAKILDLGLQNAKLDVQKAEEKQLNDKVLERLAFVKNVMNNNLQKVDEAAKAHQTASATTKNDSPETVVQVSVAPSLAQNIESRIIGARQQMSTMMSDVAREMYNNYKPPVTAFRINLLPSHLGSIAVMMKNDKDNGLSISLSMSNSATLDAMNESQSTLRNALMKNFNEDTAVSLEFSMQNDSSNSGSNSEDSSQNGQGSGNSQSSTQQDNNQQDTPQSANNYM